MPQVNGIVRKIQSVILLLIIFLVPFSFFPIIRNNLFSDTIYLFGFGALLLFSLYLITLLLNKKLSCQIRPFDIEIVLFLFAVGLSTALSSTNKIQAILNPNLGLVLFTSLTVIYFFLTHHPPLKRLTGSTILLISSFLTSITVIILSLEPSGKSNFASLDLIILFTFTLLYVLGMFISIIQKRKSQKYYPLVFGILLMIINSIALSILLFAFLKQKESLSSLLLALRAFFQIFKNPVTALFGFGVDNYSIVFNRVRDINFNQATDILRLNTIPSGRSALLHIATETGILGLFSFSYLLLSMIKKMFLKTEFTSFKIPLVLSAAFILFALFILPLSPVILFLLFFVLSQLPSDKNKKLHLNFPVVSSHLLWIGIPFILTIFAFQFLVKAFLGQYFYVKSQAAIAENNFKKVYENQQKSLILNPFMEQYHTDFSQTHLIIIQNIISQISSQSASMQSGESPALHKYTDEERRIMDRPIGVAITEARRTIDLNPKKSEYLANLASIYQVIPKEIYDKSPDTAIDLYKKALELDPNNPIYNLAIGQIYYNEQKWGEALEFLVKSANLKQNLSDAHLGLGWVYFQKKDYANAVNEGKTALSLLDQKENKNKYEIVQKSLQQFQMLAGPKGGMPDQSQPQEQPYTTVNKNGMVQMPEKPDNIPNLPPGIPTPDYYGKK